MRFKREKEMKPWIVLLLLAFIATVESQNVIAIRRIPLATSSTSSPSCEAKCAQTYPDKNQVGSSDLKHCETGCRLLNLIETVDSSPFVADDRNGDEALQNCDKSCVESFSTEMKAAPCKKGCEFQFPIAKGRRESINSVFDNFLGGFPPMRIGFPSQDNIFDSMPNFNEMFEHMNDMMGNLMTEGGAGGGGPLMSTGSNGRMVVIKSGPGYHEEKTYEFGPDGMKTEVKSEGKHMSSDMMSQRNPLETFLNGDMVDIFKPKTETKKLKDENSNKVVVDEIAREVAKEVAQEGGKNELNDDFSMIRGFDFDPPRLPDQGLRTRMFLPMDKQVQYVCSQDSENMKWSDWVTCLHIRMGLPRWLTAATISLGIVFIIWLCLVIPHNAPKQKISKAKEAAGQLEKDRLKLIMGGTPVKMDLPPSYDDIANLHVAVPIANGPLPEKKKLEEEKV